MASRFKDILLCAGAALLLGACGGSGANSGKGAIVMGDSSTIVNEADNQQLKDMVTDLQPTITPTPAQEEQPAAQEPAPAGKPAPAAPATAAAAKPAAPAALPNTPGLRAEFKEVTVLVPGLTVKQAGKADLSRANGAVYTLNGGNMNGATLRLSGNITKVSQRYQSVPVMNSSYGDLVLEPMAITTRWKEVKGANGAYAISGLDARSLEYYDADEEDVRDAVRRVGQRHRLRGKKLQDLLHSVRHVRTANQKPLHVELRSVMWKIDGKDENGRMFSKQIRVDIPM